LAIFPTPVPRQRVDDLHLLRTFLARQAGVGQPRGEPGQCRWCVARAHGDDGADPFAAFGVGQAQDGDLGDVGMLAKQGFDLLRGNVSPLRMIRSLIRPTISM